MARRTIICGLGEVGRHLARDLTEKGMDVVAIDNSPQAMSEVEATLDVMTLRGHSALPATLRAAEAHRAELVVAVTDHDETNLVTALAAKQLGATHTVARIGNRDYYPDHSGWQEQLLGVDLILCPGLLAGAEVVRLTRADAFCYVENFAGNVVQVIGVDIDEDAPAAGKPAATLALPPHCHVLSVVRDGTAQPPDAIAQLHPGDLVTVAGPVPALYEADRLLVPRSKRRGRAIVVGGGAMGRNIAEELRLITDSVTIADRDPETCERLAEELPDGISVARGNGTDLAFLDELDVRHSRILVSATSDDEVNLMGALLAKRVGVKRALAVLHRGDYAEVSATLGVDATASPRLLVAREIGRFVDRQRSAIHTRVPIDGSHLLEVQLDLDSHLVGRRLMDEDLPSGVAIAALVRDRKVVGNPLLEALRPNDVLVVHCTERALAGTRRVLIGGKANPR